MTNDLEKMYSVEDRHLMNGLKQNMQNDQAT